MWGRRDLTALPKAHLHLHLTGAMRHSHDGRARPDARSRACRPALTRGMAASAEHRRRARLVQLPAAVRHRTLGAATRRTTCTAWSGRSPRTSGPKARAGWSSRPTRPATRPGSAASPRSPSCCSTRPPTAAQATGVGIGIIIAREPDPAPARRPHAGHGSPPSTPAAASSASGCPTTSGADRRRTSSRPSASPGGPACCWPRTPASSSARPASRGAWTRCTPTGSGTASGRSRTPRSSSGWPPRRSPSRSARPRTSRSASRPTALAVPVRTLFEAGVPIALGADDPLLFGPRLVEQYEIARDVHGFSAAELAALARMSVRGSVAPTTVRTRLLAGVDAWLAGHAARPARLASSSIGAAALQGDADQDGLGLQRRRRSAACTPSLISRASASSSGGRRPAGVDQREGVLGWRSAPGPARRSPCRSPRARSATRPAS